MLLHTWSNFCCPSCALFVLVCFLFCFVFLLMHLFWCFCCWLKLYSPVHLKLFFTIFLSLLCFLWPSYFPTYKPAGAYVWLLLTCVDQYLCWSISIPYFHTLSVFFFNLGKDRNLTVILGGKESFPTISCWVQGTGLAVQKRTGQVREQLCGLVLNPVN